MKLLEIKNNLVKLSYSEGETPILGRFIVLQSEVKSYVAQFVNLKSDTVSSFAIAKLMFTFSSDGVVDNYDGSIPDINSELSLLPAGELLGLLPVENPLKIGTLAQQEDMLVVDASIFERNLTVFTDNDTNKVTFISNSIRQLFQMREKSVIIDTCNLFEDYEKIEFGKDFKLPLNSGMIDYLFEHELTEVDASTKAVIQDIFYAVQEYIRSLDFEFLPIDNFVNVVTNQYHETQMPELALLKNKLLKYRDSNIFANSQEEVFALKNQLEHKNCSVIDIKSIPEILQNEVIAFIHGVLDSFDKYIYLFVPLNDENSDKKLLKRFINNNHVFTTLFVGSGYKYAEEMQEHAQNIILFSPREKNSFTEYNTFLNKLNPEECIVCGKLTQGIPFIVSMTDLELDLTKEDVLGERYQFIPVVEDLQLVKVDEFGNKIPVTLDTQSKIDENSQDEETVEVDKETIAAIPVIEQPPIEVVEEEQLIPESAENIVVDETPSGEILQIDSEDVDLEQASVDEEPQDLMSFEEEGVLTQESLYDEGQETLDTGFMGTEDIEYTEPPLLDVEQEVVEQDEPYEMSDDFESILVDDSVSGVEDSETAVVDDASLVEEVSDSSYDESVLTVDDLNFIEDTALPQEESSFDIDNAVDTMFEEAEYEEQTPVVPVYPADEDKSSDDIGIKQGDRVTHHRYGRGVVEKIIKYGNKTLCSVSFENVGRRLLDPTITDLTVIASR